MKVTALEEYGLRCMIMLARNGLHESLTLPQLAKNEGLSIPYAGKLLALLRKGGLVSAARGRNGGYILAKPAEMITIKEIFEVLGEGIYSTKHCAKFTGEAAVCVHKDDCNVRSIWQSFDNFFGAFLEKFTLWDVVSGKINVFVPETPKSKARL